MMLPDGILRFGEPPHMNEPLLTAREAGLMLRTHISTLARWRSEDTGPKYVQMGGRIMYRESAIEQWITMCTKDPEAVIQEWFKPEAVVASVRAGGHVPGNLGELIADAFARADES